jgi:hypothetical protein
MPSENKNPGRFIPLRWVVLIGFFLGALIPIRGLWSEFARRWQCPHVGKVGEPVDWAFAVVMPLALLFLLIRYCQIKVRL